MQDTLATEVERALETAKQCSELATRLRALEQRLGASPPTDEPSRTYPIPIGLIGQLHNAQSQTVEAVMEAFGALLRIENSHIG